MDGVMGPRLDIFCGGRPWNEILKNLFVMSSDIFQLSFISDTTSLLPRLSVRSVKVVRPRPLKMEGAALLPKLGPGDLAATVETVTRYVYLYNICYL